MSGESPGCAEWCTGQHLPTWPSHRGEVTEVLLGPLMVEICTTQWADCPAQTTVTVADVEHQTDTVVDLDMTTASELVGALGESLAHVYGRGSRP
ncbi:MAG: hypothetical protein ACJ73S_09930 [Mycobacteriales bacterium]